MSNGGRTLVVKGQGIASAEPDLTVLSFTVLGRDPSYSTAVEELNDRVEALRGDITKEGVGRHRLKTTNFQVRTEYRYDEETGKREFLNYEASHRLRLELPLDKERLNRVLGRVATSTSEASVSVSFDVSDRESMKREAMRAAVTDARESAEVLAEASGVELGKIGRIDYSYVEIRSRSFSYDTRMRAMDMKESAATPDIKPEELEASENVTIVWEIESDS